MARTFSRDSALSAATTSIEWKAAVALTLAAFAAFALANVFGLSHAYWAPMSVWVVAQPYADLGLPGPGNAAGADLPLDRDMGRGSKPLAWAWPLSGTYDRHDGGCRSVAWPPVADTKRKCWA